MQFCFLHVLRLENPIPGALDRVTTYNVFPRTFQHSSPHAFQCAYFFDILTKMIDVGTNSALIMPTHHALNFSWGEP